MKENKKRNVLLIVAIATVLLTIIGATYAYYTASIGDATIGDVEARTGTTDSLTFKTEDEININASILNFGEGQTSLRDDAKAIATLIAGTDSTPSMNYYVYMIIDKNEFTYTTEAKTAELLLKVTDPNGNAVTSIPGLDYVTTTVDGANESGFDITEHKGLIKIAELYNITTDSEKIDEWTVEVVYINLNTNQNEHLDKNINGTIIIQKDELTYREYCDASTLACKIVKNYTTDGDNGLYYHDGIGTYTNANLEAGDKSYRYSGSSSSINNYVCLGSSAETCPANNLYRIIGLFPTDETAENYQVKLIKNTSNGTDCWSGKNNNFTNVWANSILNTSVLNSTFFNSLGNDKTKISSHDWAVGGVSDAIARNGSAKSIYEKEIIGSATYNAKVALMYASDYLYSALPQYWTTAGTSYRSNLVTGWLITGINDTELTLCRISDTAYNMIIIDHGGPFNASGNYGWYSMYRPVLYLNENVEFSTGTGVSGDPYRIK